MVEQECCFGNTLVFVVAVAVVVAGVLAVAAALAATGLPLLAACPGLRRRRAARETATWRARNSWNS